MEIFTSLVNNYKESMEGLNAFVKVAITAVAILALLAIVSAIINAIFVVV